MASAMKRTQPELNRTSVTPFLTLKLLTCAIACRWSTRKSEDLMCAMKFPRSLQCAFAMHPMLQRDKARHRD
ncbi:hypothetical protein BKA82DRAFT_1000042 [Pisolithus tinctorius]|uniref:Uncharacterized protein n=1 Tax=Pisolithus tinctorius Marx 270 TaxID=870435 RepID=A0A0C3K5V4_PISTI|nr:hypothetical protein BKA82DRAFT_1000042 [Pisolithus tinctorius]KIO04962.1 hypothetical protein M404DRAFT_1000042 [Pisolithus tinctorius Marx 270]